MEHNQHSRVYECGSKPLYVQSCGHDGFEAILYSLLDLKTMPRAATYPKSTKFCATLNNYTDAQVDTLKAWARSSTKYCCIAKEVGESGTPHLQVFFQVKQSRISAFRGESFFNWHIEVARGTPKQNREYCKKGSCPKLQWDTLRTNAPDYGKDADVWECGLMVSQGKRTDLDKVKIAIHTGAITNTHQLDSILGVGAGAARHGAKLIASKFRPPRRAAPTVYWCYGASGSGKSYAVSEYIERMCANHGYDYYSALAGRGTFFDGYHGQEIAWFDDYRCTDLEEFIMWIKMCQGYRLQVQVKGSSVAWEPKIILFTSVKPPTDVFADVSASHDEDVTQVTRRITRTFDFSADGKEQFAELIDPLVGASFVEKDLKHIDDYVGDWITKRCGTDGDDRGDAEGSEPPPGDGEPSDVPVDATDLEVSSVATTVSYEREEIEAESDLESFINDTEEIDYDNDEYDYSDYTDSDE